MRHNMEKVKNLLSTRKYMSFAGASKILQLQPCHDDVINDHATKFAIELEYVGP
jgi:hypothetical protein